MHTMRTYPAVFDLGLMNVKLLDDDDLVAIGGGADPVSVGCALALGGVVVVLIGVTVGVVMYALMN